MVVPKNRHDLNWLLVSNQFRPKSMVLCDLDQGKGKRGRMAGFIGAINLENSLDPLRHANAKSSVCKEFLKTFQKTEKTTLLVLTLKGHSGHL